MSVELLVAAVVVTVLSSVGLFALIERVVGEEVET
jgi:hypothetical protein